MSCRSAWRQRGSTWCMNGSQRFTGGDRKSTRLNSSHTVIYTLSLHDALPISLMVPSTVLITDELSLGLAPAWLDVVYERLAEVHRRGTAVLIIEQQIDRALAIADSAVVLQRGSVCYVGTPSGAASVAEELITTPGAGWAAPGPGT